MLYPPGVELLVSVTILNPPGVGMLSYVTFLYPPGVQTSAYVTVLYVHAVGVLDFVLISIHLVFAAICILYPSEEKLWFNNSYKLFNKQNIYTL